MKKLTMLVATFVLAIPAPLTMPTAAAAASNTEVVGACKDIVAAGELPGLTVGQCVSLLTTEDNYYNDGTSAGGFAAQACRLIENFDPADFYYVYPSYSACVQDGASQLI
jgi:hypothetical protein